MARNARSRPGRTLGVLVALIAVIFGLIGLGTVVSDAQWSPKLALDLEGGTEIVLSAVPQPGVKGEVTPQILTDAVKVIRQRINGSGVSEAEITTQGDRNIIVSLPGKTDQATKDSVTRAAALEFRPVLLAAQTELPVQATPSGSASPSASGSASPSASAATSPVASASATAQSASSATAAPASASATASASASPSSNGVVLPAALRAASATPTASATASGSPSAATGSASPSAPPKAAPIDPSSDSWATPDLIKQFSQLDCSKPANLKGRPPSDPKKGMVACGEHGEAKYVLGPRELAGTDISGASASLEVNQQGVTGTNWQVNLDFTGEGGGKFADTTKRLVSLTEPKNRFAIMLDGLVVSAPTTNEAITGGRAQITGRFSQVEAQSLANQLKFGALPISFQVETDQNISATLGGEQLQRGLLAGVIGLILVVIYSLLQYRLLGLVTVFSLTIAGVLTYGLVVLLGWRQGYRLSLAGVAGLIVSIGITADSFIVYFERIRDEVRDGRPLRLAVDLAWSRARRTILISDAVSFLAAVVLYLLALGGVRGFAFTLGLTTVVDIAVVFLFTHPVMVLLAQTRFFGGGHPWSGFDAAHLGRQVTYTGRGTSRPPRGTAKGKGVASSSERPLTIAERRAAEERALSHEPGTEADDQPADSGSDSSDGASVTSAGRDA